MKHLLCLIALFFALNGWSQDVQFIENYLYQSCTYQNINASEESIEFVLPTSDGGYLLVGSYRFSLSDTDGFLKKIGDSGQEEWCEWYGGFHLDYFRAAVEFNGSYFVVGDLGSSVGGSNLLILQYSLEGQRIDDNQITNLSIPEGANSHGTTVEASFNGNLVVGGIIDNISSGDGSPSTEGFYVEINSGTLAIDPATEHHGVGTAVLKIARTSNTSYWVFGEEYDPIQNEWCINGSFIPGTSAANIYESGYYSDIFVTRIDVNLQNPNNFDLGGNTPETFIDAISTPDGGFAILGVTHCESNTGISGPGNVCKSQPDEFNPYWVFKGTAQGTTDWSNSHDGTFYRPFGLIMACNQSDIVFSGLSPYFEIGHFFRFYKTSSQTPFPQIIGESGYFDYSGFKAFDLQRGSTGELLVGGGYFPQGSSNEDLWLGKFSTDCFSICENAISLTCGEPYPGNTTLSSNDFEAADYLCPGFIPNNPFDAGDDLFLLQKNTPGDLVINLFSDGLNLDVFVFNNCTGESWQCLDSGTSSGGYEVIEISNAPNGDYYIVVDGNNASQEGEYVLTATCGNLDCSSASIISCGEFITDQTDSNTPNNVSLYCNTGNFFGTGCTGPEKVYQLNLDVTTEITIHLDPHSNEADFELFLLNSCDASECIDFSTNIPGENELIDTVLVAGTYYIVVDGWRETSGWYDLWIEDCNDPCENYFELFCGVPYSGNTSWGDNDFSDDDLDCFSSSDPYSAKDDLFLIQKNEPGDLVVTLFSEGIDHDIFLLSSCSGELISCFDYSVNPVANNNLNYDVIIAPDLPIGQYYILVDGKSLSDEGEYVLTATCGYLDCSFALPISCGQTLQGQHNSGELSQNNVSRYCNQTQPFDGGLGCTGRENVYQFTLNGLSDVEILLTPDSGLSDFELFLLNSCNANNCIASSTNEPGVNEIISSQLPAGTYYIVVDGWRETQGSYSLTLNCCQDPVYYFGCESIDYEYLGSGLNYRFFTQGLANYAENVNWIIGGQSVPSIQNFVDFSFFGEGTYEVCAPFYTQEGSNCIDYCCTTYCIKEMPDCLEGLIPPCETDCACFEGEDSNLPAPFLCETFNSYVPNNDVTFQSDQWSMVNGFQYATVVSDAEEQYLNLSPIDGFNPGVLLSLNSGNHLNLTCGRYRLSWLMQVAENSTGGLRVVYDNNQPITPGNIGSEVWFDQDGQAYFRTQGDEELEEISFGYSQGSWMKVMFIVDLGKDRLEFWLNDRFIEATSTFSLSFSGMFNNSGSLGGVMFYGDQDTDSNVENICVRAKPDSHSCTAGGEQVCVKNGESYANECVAGQEGLYTGNEMEICLSVCNYGGEFIGRDDAVNIQNVVNTYEQAPNLIYSDADILNYYDQDVPFPLYSDLYIFDNEPDGQISVNLSGDVDAFVYECVCNEQGCYASFVGNYNELNGPQSEGLYYILVVSETPNADYGITIFPSSECDLDGSPILSCGSLINDDFDGQQGGFEHNGAISDCYNGTRNYSGIGNVYRFEVDEASVVDIQMDAEDGAAGMFLFANSCGTNCIGYAETSLNGGLAVIEGATLADGYYYLIIYEETEVPTYTLTISCAEDENNIGLFLVTDDDFCESDPSMFHTVGIDFNTVSDQGVAPDDEFSITIKPVMGESTKYGIGTQYNVGYSPENDILFPNLTLYTGGDLDNQCTFLEEDTISLGLVRENIFRPLKPIFEPMNSPSVNAEEIFSIGGVSKIIDYIIECPGITFDLPNGSLFRFIAEGGSESITAVAQGATGLEWEVESQAPWIQITSSGPYSGYNSFMVSVGENEGFDQRTGYVVVRTVLPPIVSKTIKIVQDAPCRTPEINLFGDTLPPIRACFGEPVEIVAEVLNAPANLYDFFWDGEKTPSGNIEILEENDLPVGPTNHTLLVEQRSCISAKVTIDFLVVVAETPEVPVLNTNNLVGCNQDGQFQIENPMPNVQYKLRNDFGFEETVGIQFLPPENGTYYLEAYDANNPDCISQPVQLIYDILGQVILTDETQDSQVCVGQPFTLSVSSNLASDGLDFTWNNGIEDNSPTVEFIANEPGTLVFSVFAEGGDCTSNLVDIEVQVFASPDVPELQATEITNCSDQDSSFNILNYDPEITYVLVDQEGEEQIVGDQFIPDQSGTYFLEAYSTGNNECRSPAMELSYELLEEIIIQDETSVYEVCSGDPITLTVSSDLDSEDLDFIWNNGISENTSSIEFIPDESGPVTFAVTAQKQGCFSNTVTIPVDVYHTPALPELNDFDITSCSDDQQPFVIQNVEQGVIYQWRNQDGDFLEEGISFTPPNTGIYTVEAYNDLPLECRSEQVELTYSIVDSVVLETTIQETLQVCLGDPVTLSVMANVPEESLEFSWSHGIDQNAATVEFTPDQIGAFTIMVNAGNENCDAEPLEIELNVTEIPPIPAVDNVAFCPDFEQDSLEVENPGANYTTKWYVSESATSSIHEGDVFTPENSGTYWVELANENCSSERVEVTYTIGDTFDLQLMADANQTCQGISVPITATINGNSANVDYFWTGDVAGNSTEATFFATNIGTQTVQLAASNGICSDMDFIEIEVGASNISDPVIDNNNIVFCEDELDPAITVEVSDPDKFTVFWYDGEGALVHTGLEYLNPSFGEYSIQTVDADVNICTSPGLIPLSVSEVEAIDANIVATNSPGCEGEPANLTVQASGGSASENLLYTWSEDSFGQGASVDFPLPAGPNTYFVTITDSQSSCMAIKAITVEGTPQPGFSYLAEPECISTQAYGFSIFSNASQVSIISGGGAIDPDGNVYNFTIPVGQDISVRLRNQEVGITCDTLINIISPEDCDCFDSDVENAQPLDDIVEICEGDTANLVVHAPLGNNIVYWYPSASTEGLPFEIDTIYQTQNAGTYYPVVYDPDAACFGDFAEITLLVNESPTADAGEDMAVCINDTVTLDGTGSSGSGQLQYEWTAGVELSDNTIPNPELEASEGSISIALEVTDANGCTASDIVIVNATESPGVEIVEFEGIMCYGDATGRLGANVTSEFDINSITWSSGDDGLIIDELQAGEYIVTVVDANECVGLDTFELNQPEEFVFTDTVTTVMTNSDGEVSNSGKVKYSYTGGTPPFEFEWYLNGELVSNLDATFSTLVPGEVILIITDANDCEYVYEFEITIVGLSYVENLGKLIVSPNPFSDRFYVEAEFNSSVNLIFYVYNSLGERVKKLAFDNVFRDRLEVDLNDFPDGIYWLHMEIGENIITEKIIKMK